MTDRINERTPSDAQSGFLRSAPKAQRIWWMTRGEPECLRLQTFGPEGLSVLLYPSLRGVGIGKPVATVEEAVAKAAAVKADLLATEELEPVDEAALGIDDEATELATLLTEASVRIETIAHVGTMQEGSMSDPLAEIVDDLDGDHLVSALVDLPFLVPLLRSEERTTSAEFREEFSMRMHDAGADGFLVQASVPTLSPHRDGKGASVHYGDRRTDVFYASTFRHACLKALAWGEAENAAMMAGGRDARTERAVDAAFPRPVPTAEPVDDRQAQLPGIGA